ncbi:hypothetical protein ACGF07_26080 [Kitasatospora sp. NPDC048194]|uniref:hypothetical protein n=1 Tax=Kitasatospora sp. NPDC048194 TaxID=3364045 RepID=UPI0037149155
MGKWKHFWQLLAGAVLILLIVYFVALAAGLIGQQNHLSALDLIVIIVAVVIATGLANSYIFTKFSATRHGLEFGLENVEKAQREIGLKQNKLASGQEGIKEDLEMLELIMMALVKQYEEMHLRNLAKDGPYRVQHRDSMMKELTQLYDLGYLTPKKAGGLDAITADHAGSGDHFDLKEYLEVTPRGMKFLEIYNRYVKATAA